MFASHGGRSICPVLTWDLFWRLVVGGVLLGVGAVTARAGWLGVRGRLRPPAGTPATSGAEAVFAAGARVAGPPLLVAGGVAVAGGLAAVAQPTNAAMFTVAGVVLLGLVGLALATRPLVGRAATAVRRQLSTTRSSVCGQSDCQSTACAGCPFQTTGQPSQPARPAASCAPPRRGGSTAGRSASPGGAAPGPTGQLRPAP